jgi:hypothetical protein
MAGTTAYQGDASLFVAAAPAHDGGAVMRYVLRRDKFGHRKCRARFLLMLGVFFHRQLLEVVAQLLLKHALRVQRAPHGGAFRWRESRRDHRVQLAIPILDAAQRVGKFERNGLRFFGPSRQGKKAFACLARSVRSALLDGVKGGAQLRSGRSREWRGFQRKRDGFGH